MGMKGNSIDLLPNWLLIAISCVLLNAVFSQVYSVWDLSEGKLHSLSGGSLEILEQLKSPVVIRYYQSKSENSMPYQLRDYAEKVRYFLEAIQAHSAGKIRLEKIDPTANSDEEDMAVFEGIEPRAGAKKSEFYFGLSVSSLEQTRNIPFLHPDRGAYLEYDLLRLIQSVSETDYKVVGIMSSLPIQGRKSINGDSQEEFPQWLFLTEVRNAYLTKVYDNVDNDILSNPPDVLLLIQPQLFDARTERVLMEYVEQGGNLIMMLDPFSVASEMIGDKSNRALSSRGVSRFLSHLGVNYKEQAVVADIKLSSQVNRGFGPETSLTVLNIGERFLHTDAEITSGVSNLSFPYAGHFWPDEQRKSGYELVPLVTTSEQSSEISSSSLIALTKEKNQNLMNTFQPDGQRRALVVKLNRKVPEENNRPSSQIVLFADTDFIFDPFAGESVTLSGRSQTFKPYNDNIALFINTLDALTGKQNVSQIRGSGAHSYPLIGLNDIRTEIESHYMDDRQRLFSQERALREQLEKLSDAADSNSINQFMVEKKQSSFLMDELAFVTKSLTKIDQNIERDFQSQINIYQWTLILTAPVFVFLFGATVVVRRERRTRAQ